MIYDMHIHLDLMDNMFTLIQEIQYSALSILAVGTTPKAYKKDKEFCHDCDNVRVALGMHPQIIGSGYDDFKMFKSLLLESHYIGEIGLDFRNQYIGNKDKQIQAFSEIIKLCESDYNDYSKVISIHSVKAVSTTLEILAKYKKSNNKYILHWFTGNVSQLGKAIEIGCYFSVNPRMLKTKSGKEIIKLMPEDRMLLETDSPFAGQYSSAYDIENELKNTEMKISELIRKDISEIIKKNSEKLF